MKIVEVRDDSVIVRVPPNGAVEQAVPMSEIVNPHNRAIIPGGVLHLNSDGSWHVGPGACDVDADIVEDDATAPVEGAE